MSHITNINLIVKDLDAMDATAKRLGLELVRNQKTFVGYTQGHCDHVLRVAGAPAGTYEIGLVKRSDGKGYDLKWDADMGQYAPALRLYQAVGYESIDHKIGYRTASPAKLLDWYAATVTKKQMARQGFRVTLSQQERKVQVVCNK